MITNREQIHAMSDEQLDELDSQASQALGQAHTAHGLANQERLCRAFKAAYPDAVKVCFATEEYDNGYWYTVTSVLDGSGEPLTDESPELDDNLDEMLTSLSDYYGPLGRYNSDELDLVECNLITGGSI